jgi:hypothetical protein
MWRILKRLGLNRLPASQRYKRHNIRWKRYEKQPPGHQLQIDVKFIESLGQKGSRRKKYYHQFTAIDCTRLRVLRAHPGEGGAGHNLFDYLTTRPLDSTGMGKAMVTRWKPAPNAFGITLEGRFPTR